MTKETFQDLADSSRNNYNKKNWLEVNSQLVRKENPVRMYVPNYLGKQ
jgi:hypothetical protein